MIGAILGAALAAAAAAGAGVAAGVASQPVQVEPVVQAPDMHAIAVEAGGANDVLVPVSDSVRAATWDWLSAASAKPTPAAEMHVKVACIVFYPLGAPGACIDAARIPAGASTVDWAALRAQDEAELMAGPADVLARREVVVLRLSALRMKAQAATPPRFAVRVFDEAVGPGDARPAATPAPLFNFGEVALEAPLQGELLEALYPVRALRDELRARVEVRCRIEPSRRLLCRDPGKVTLLPYLVREDSDEIEAAFRLATYQLASTLQLKPEAKDGRPVAGSDLRLVINWEMP